LDSILPIRISDPTATQPFETRLMKYSLAVGALCAAPLAHAEIIYSGALNLPAAPSLAVNFSPLAGSVFTLDVSPTEIDVSTSAGTGFDIGPLTLGAPITLASTTTTGLQKLVQGLDATPFGLWATSSHGYLGVSFTVSSQQYLGWAELQLDNGTPSATLVSYAYNDEAGQAIAAGDTGVPEPSSLTLFALGAAGVLALRRRRQAQARSFRQS
jgi:hypothetical protein